MKYLLFLLTLVATAPLYAQKAVPNWLLESKQALWE
jgi:hypothetical protein